MAAEESEAVLGRMGVVPLPDEELLLRKLAGRLNDGGQARVLPERGKGRSVYTLRDRGNAAL